MAHALLLSLCIMTGIAASIASEKKPFQKPWFCHNLDCPRYAVVETTTKYEERIYESSKWVSTKIQGSRFLVAQREGFQRLFNYISGKNKEGKKVPMTTPVRSFIQPGDGPFCSTDFTVSFFVPFDYTDKTPIPSSKDLFIQENSEMTVFVVEFGGWMKETDIQSRAQELIEHLQKKGIEVETDTYYAAAYDSPFRLIGRHNEIWIKKKGGNSLSA